jgi:hypothetical protein
MENTKVRAILTGATGMVEEGIPFMVDFKINK